MYGIYPLLKLNRILRGHRLKFLGILVARRLRIRHLFLRVDPIVACNLECLMCPYSDPEKRKEPHTAFDDMELERIADMLFPRARQVVVGCSYEPTMAKNFWRVLELAKQYRVPHTGLVSNGQLLGHDDLERLQTLGLEELVLSLHGATKATYEKMMVRASWDRFLNLLRTVSRVKAGRADKRPHLRLNYTVNRENMGELDNFFDVFGDFPLSVLQLRPMFRFRESDLALRPGDFAEYREKVENLGLECRSRRITFLANSEDPDFERPNYAGLALPYVYYYVDPARVWRPDFDWRRESYEEFCRRIGLDRQLLRDVFAGKDELFRRADRYRDSARYELS